MSSIISGRQHIVHTMKASTAQSTQAIPCMSRFIGNKSKLLILAFLAVCCITAIRWYAIASVPVTTISGQTSYDSDQTLPNDSEQIVTHDSKEPEQTISHSFEQTFNYSTQQQQLKKRLPDFIIIGVKKCGTRALLNFLKMHPDIVEAGMEVHFFDRNESYGKGLEWYRQMMPESLPHQLTGEKSPGYYRETLAPERIHDMNSSIKLILVVREPIERCMSNYLQHASKNDGLSSFENEVLSRNGEVNERSPHVFNSNYNLFIKYWLRWFPLKQLRVVDGNLLITDPHLVLKELQDFLGVRQYIDEKFFKFDKEKGFYCYHNKSTDWKCLGDTKGRKHPPMSPRVKQKLYEYFKPRNDLFFQKIGKRFDWDIDTAST